MKKLFVLSLVFGLFVGIASADDCCADKKSAKSGCGTNANVGEDAFMAEAKRMMLRAKAAEKGQDDCCQSTEAKPMAKGDEGCCNAAGEVAKFKVYVAGVGYKFFGCEESAGKERTALMAKHGKVGPVQRVTGRVLIH